jgi:hypothetical protein
MVLPVFAEVDDDCVKSLLLKHQDYKCNTNACTQIERFSNSFEHKARQVYAESPKFRPKLEFWVVLAVNITRIYTMLFCSWTSEQNISIWRHS